MFGLFNKSLHSLLLDSSSINCKDKIIKAIEKGADLEEMDGNNFTPLMMAVHLSSITNVSTVLKSIKKGAFAQGEVSAEVVETLIDAGCNVNASNGANTPLLIACMPKTRCYALNGPFSNTWGMALQSDKILKLLIDNGSDVNYRNLGGQTPLMLAAFDGYEFAVKELIKAGADKNVVDNDGKKALDLLYSNVKVDRDTRMRLKDLLTSK